MIFFALVLLFGFTVFFGAPYVPSKSKELIDAFKNLYPLSKNDLLIDLGSGDGIVLKIASSFGAKSIGIEMNPIFAVFSKIRLRKNKSAKVVCKNFYHYVFPQETTIIYMFCDARDIEKMFDKVSREASRLNKKLYIISLAFKSKKYKPIKNRGVYFLYEISNR